MGNVASETDPTGAVVKSIYDANGQTLQSTSTKGSLKTGSTSAYNPNGSLCWSTPLVIAGTPDCANPPLAALNQTTLNYYDQDGRLVATTNPGTVTYSPATPAACNPLTSATCDGVTYYSYDEVGHRTQTTAPAGPSGVRATTTNYFDASGNLVATLTPIGAGTGCNPLTTSTCLGASYSTYDAQNRLLTVSYTDGTPSVSYSYNADGSKATQSDGTGTSTFSYDSAGRLIGNHQRGRGHHDLGLQHARSTDLSELRQPRRQHLSRFGGRNRFTPTGTPHLFLRRPRSGQFAQHLEWRDSDHGL